MDIKSKLKDAMASAEFILSREYGSLSLEGKDLTDKNGNSLYKRYDVVDRISKELDVAATIFVRDGGDYRRISTSITGDSGNRIIDTMLDQKSAAYPHIQAGQEFSGDVFVLGKKYLAEYRPILASGGKDVIGILFVGIETP
jgi:methyl-accepting chemotaxis protein